ncbi:protein De4 [Common bottlenose dolphin gammaherpesvirus 1 strain Sarasota]|uniref:Protein De4 n=1 Tax=Common bottlenose dolphin gammaherpesvirus 1 strain Sarasota TaxID=2022783 RepID=A0A1Z1NED9_9GAMA|nr:protein De4 [Common bottlenose dolphin gammaherpesvirus 1 strain Sarasota]ARW78070.1 protein De4 [Common bottlenose dolphin gammaherpesvirus 1 strain Sarasota]
MWDCVHEFIEARGRVALASDKHFKHLAGGLYGHVDLHRQYIPVACFAKTCFLTVTMRHQEPALPPMLDAPYLVCRSHMSHPTNPTRPAPPPNPTQPVRVQTFTAMILTFNNISHRIFRAAKESLVALTQLLQSFAQIWKLFLVDQFQFLKLFFTNKNN